MIIVITVNKIHRKKYGCAAFFVNLSMYLMFILPFTALTIIVKSREKILCAHNATAGQVSKYSALITPLQVRWLNLYSRTAS